MGRSWAVAQAASVGASAGALAGAPMAYSQSWIAGALVAAGFGGRNGPAGLSCGPGEQSSTYTLRHKLAPVDSRWRGQVRMAVDCRQVSQPFFPAADSPASVTVETILVRTQAAAMPSARWPSPSLSSASALAGSTRSATSWVSPVGERLRVWGHRGSNTVECG